MMKKTTVIDNKNAIVDSFIKEIIEHLDNICDQKVLSMEINLHFSSFDEYNEYLWKCEGYCNFITVEDEKRVYDAIVDYFKSYGWCVTSITLFELEWRGGISDGDRAWRVCDFKEQQSIPLIRLHKHHNKLTICFD